MNVIYLHIRNTFVSCHIMHFFPLRNMDSTLTYQQCSPLNSIEVYLVVRNQCGINLVF